MPFWVGLYCSRRRVLLVLPESSWGGTRLCRLLGSFLSDLLRLFYSATMNTIHLGHIYPATFVSIGAGDVTTEVRGGIEKLPQHPNHVPPSKTISGESPRCLPGELGISLNIIGTLLARACFLFSSCYLRPFTENAPWILTLTNLADELS